MGVKWNLRAHEEGPKKEAFEEYGETLKGAAEAIWVYNKGNIL